MNQKRSYHQWQRPEIRALAASYESQTNKALAQRFRVTVSAIENLLHRERLIRSCRTVYVDPNQLTIDWTYRLHCFQKPSFTEKKGKPPKEKRKTKTELFLEQEQQYGTQAFQILTQAKELIEEEKIEAAQVLLEECCPLPVYELIIVKTDPPNKLRDCLFALSRWVMRIIERNPNATIKSDVGYLESYMNQQCKFC